MSSIVRVMPEIGGLHLTGFQVRMTAGELTEVNMVGIVNDYAVLRALQASIFEGAGPLTSMRLRHEEEYFCLYCASPNLLTSTHCKKCGAPRGFLFGSSR